MAKKLSKRTQTLQLLLQDWYAKHKRDLPWRRTSDPYAIWISEVMLQQTRVDTVINYWHRFLLAFPTLKDLAQASEQSVLQQWQGLGYYRRAKYLHNAAKALLVEYEGHWPQTAAELIALPGFGPYTSGAVASIAFGEKTPCVDGNVKRVLGRIEATHDSVETTAWQLAQCSDPSSLNQSLMELGATVCTTAAPKCLFCPVQNHCRAFKKNHVDLYPAPKKKKKSKNIWAVSLAIQNEKQQYLFQKRNQPGRWEGLWEFPFWEWTHEPDILVIQAMVSKTFPHVDHLTEKGHLKHVLTHQNIAVRTLHANATSLPSTSSHQAWLPLEQRQKPISTLQQKIIGLIKSSTR